MSLPTSLLLESVLRCELPVDCQCIAARFNYSYIGIAQLSSLAWQQCYNTYLSCLVLTGELTDTSIYKQVVC